MTKRFSFVLLIAFLHLLFAFAVTGATLKTHRNDPYAAPGVRILLNPLFYPLRHTALASHGWALPLVAANSLLWGIMAERLVWGRKKIARRVSKAQ